MSRTAHTTGRMAVVSPWRCTGVWLAVTAVVGALGRHLVSTATAPGSSAGNSVEDALVALAAAALVGCGAWLWLVTTVTAVEAWRRGTVHADQGGLTRRLVLLGCGAVVAAGVTGSPAAAEGGTLEAPAVSLLAGLPLPERAAAPATAERRPVVSPGGHPTEEPRATVVRPGDSLWRIAERRLPPGAEPAVVDAAWRRLHSHNRAAVTDPDLIHPGQRLVLPANLGPAGPTDRE